MCLGIFGKHLAWEFWLSQTQSISPLVFHPCQPLAAGVPLSRNMPESPYAVSSFLDSCLAILCGIHWKAQASLSHKIHKDIPCVWATRCVMLEANYSKLGDAPPCICSPSFHPCISFPSYCLEVELSNKALMLRLCLLLCFLGNWAKITSHLWEKRGSSDFEKDRTSERLVIFYFLT